MEPTSALATAVLAAASILPQIEVTLRNWDNRTGRVVIVITPQKIRTRSK